MANGGKRPGAGRKSKAEEIALIEKLSPYDDIAIEALIQGVEKKEFPFIKLFLEYRYGKAKETVDLNTKGGIVINLKPANESGG